MSKTVFIIGAGGSLEFGESMPVGSGLANMIRECLTEELENHRQGGATPIIDAISYSGFSSQHTEVMARIRDGIITKESIDDFVDEWKDIPMLPEVAKVAISYCISSAEARTKLAELSPPRTAHGYRPDYDWAWTTNPPNRAAILAALRSSWLGCVLRYHNTNASRRSFLEAMQDTSFIVFNYDRCIEQYLWHHLTTALAVPRDEAGEVIRSVPIIHVFGSIGQLPELGGSHPFGSSEPHHINNSAPSIRTYSESVDGLIRDRIASIIESAAKIVFLGCAFHRQNLNLLLPSGPPKMAEIWGTCLGVRSRRLNELKYVFGSTMAHFIDAEAGQMLDRRRDDIFS